MLHLVLAALLLHWVAAMQGSTASSVRFPSSRQEQSPEPSFLQVTSELESPGKVVELAPEDMATYIATGLLPGQKSHSTGPTFAELTQNFIRQVKEAQKDSAHGHFLSAIQVPSIAEVDMAIARTNNITDAEEQEYLAALQYVTDRGMRALQDTRNREQTLEEDFLNTYQLLTGMLHDAAVGASQAEVRALLERLERIHYEQVAMLDRSAAYWKAQEYQDNAMTRLADTKTALEENAQNVYQMEGDQLIGGSQRVRDEEKSRIDSWRDQFQTQVSSDAVSDQLRSSDTLADQLRMRARAALVTQEQQISSLKQQIDTSAVLSGSMKTPTAGLKATDNVQGASSGGNLEATTVVASSGANLEAANVVEVAPGVTIPVHTKKKD